jgi:hypothetical protein
VAAGGGALSALPIDVRQPALGVNHPDETRARSQPVTDFAEHVAGAIARGTDLDDQIGRECGEARRRWVGNTFAPNERDVRASNGVRVRGELESGIADEDEPKIVSIDVLEEHGAETRHERTMLEARRLTHDQDSANQLQLLAGDVHPQQLVGCHQRWHVRNVGGLGGHDNK